MTELEMVVRYRAGQIAQAFKKYQTEHRIKEYGFDPIEIAAKSLEDAEDAERYRFLRDNEFIAGDLDSYVDMAMAKKAAAEARKNK